MKKNGGKCAIKCLNTLNASKPQELGSRNELWQLC